MELAAPGVVSVQKIPIPGYHDKRITALFVWISLMQRLAYSPVRYLSRFLFLPRDQMTSSSKLRTHKKLSTVTKLIFQTSRLLMRTLELPDNMCIMRMEARPSELAAIG